jgi:hypothetical protein
MSDAKVARRRLAAVGLMQKFDERIIGCQPCDDIGSVVGRAVIDHDQLISGQALGQDTSYRLLYKFRAVVQRDDGSDRYVKVAALVEERRPRSQFGSLVHRQTPIRTDALSRPQLGEEAAVNTVGDRIAAPLPITPKYIQPANPYRRVSVNGCINRFPQLQMTAVYKVIVEA